MEFILASGARAAAQGRSVLREWSGRATSRWVVGSNPTTAHLIPPPDELQPPRSRSPAAKFRDPGVPPDGLRVSSPTGRFARVALKKRVCHGCNIVKAHPEERPLLRGDRSRSTGANRPSTDGFIRVACAVVHGMRGQRASRCRAWWGLRGRALGARNASSAISRMGMGDQVGFFLIRPGASVFNQRCCVRPADVLHDRYRESGPV